MRKSLLALSLLVAAAAGIARAEVAAEAIPPEFIQQFAPIAVALVEKQFPDPPVKIEPDSGKAQGYHVKQMMGVVVMPDKNLNATAVAGAGEKEVPVGVMATLYLSLEDQAAADNKGAVINGDRLAVVQNELIKLPIFFMAVKGKGEVRTLELYSKGGKPVASAPLTKKEGGDATFPVTVKLSNIDLEKKKLEATISLGRAYESTLKMGYVQL